MNYDDTLDALLDRIDDPSSIHDLADALCALYDLRDSAPDLRSEIQGILETRMPDLRCWGSNPPADTWGIWSWDDEYFIADDGCGSWDLVLRSEYDGDGQGEES